MKRFLAFLLLLIITATAAVPQMPRDRRAASGNLYDIRRTLAKAQFSRLVTVDSGGMGDFKTLSAALNYVAGQEGRTGTNRWLVKVYPGTPISGGISQYEDQTLTCPTWTTVQGEIGGWTNGSVLGGVPSIRLTGSIGTLVSLGQGCVLVNLDFISNTPTNGAVKFLSVTGSPALLTNVSVRVTPSVTDANDIDLVSLENGGSLSATSLQVQRGDGNTKTRGLVANGNASATLYLGRLRSGLGSPALIENAGTGQITLNGTRLEGGATFDLKRSGSGAIVTQGVAYTFSSGVIDDSNLRAKLLLVNGGCAIKSGTGSPNGVQPSNPCDLWLRSDGPPYLYRKVSGSDGNGWAAVGPVTQAARPSTCQASETFYVTGTNEWCVCPAANTPRCVASTFIP
jgi:hypothetical protein